MSAKVSHNDEHWLFEIELWKQISQAGPNNTRNKSTQGDLIQVF